MRAVRVISSCSMKTWKRNALATCGPRSSRRNCAPLCVNPIVDIREDIVPGFDLAEPWFVDYVGLDLFVEVVEVEDVDLGPLAGVFDHGAGLHDECPVA